MRFVPALAVAVTGLALYVSRGVLDQILTSEGLVRVALLPPPQVLGGFVALAALGLLWLDRRAVPRASATQVHPALGPLLLPVLGLLVLIVPYLPYLSDAFPVLQMIAGPLRGVIWLAIAMQLVWVLWQIRLLRADWLQQWTLRRAAVAIAVMTAVLSGVAAARLTGTVLFPAGDEPHYLIIAQSLWRDRDLKIENNHVRRDYGEYYPMELDPHYLTRGADGEIYSIHPIGMPVLIAPVYAAGGYRAVVVMFVLMAAAAAALMWHAVVRATNAIGAATFGCVAIVATTPFLYNSFAIYPEVPAALAAVIALSVTFGGAGPRESITRFLIVGLACAALPWLSTKYAPMSAALALIAVARILWPTVYGPRSTVYGPRSTADGPRSTPDSPRSTDDGLPSPQHSTSAPGTGSPVLRHLRASLPAMAALLAPYAVSLAGWFYFFYAVWGSPRPQAPYGDLVQTRVFNLIFGAPGLLFDQEYGLLPYAPVYILAVTGLWVMWRDGGEMRRRAIEVTIAFGALLGTVGAFRIWWGGSASPGRPLTSGLLLLSLPLAMAFRNAPVGSARRAAHHLLLWLSIGITVVALVAREGFLITNGRDGTSTLLEYLSPRWPAWTLVPSFIHHEAGTALLHTLAWLALAAVAALVLDRVRVARAGAASLIAMATCFGALWAAAIVVPLLPATPAWPDIDLRARPRLPLLDAFDALARPVGIEYAPMRVVSAVDLPARAALGVEPGFRIAPQPIRVLHNGRFSLPAGRYRIDVEWSGAHAGETIGLQIGRTGDPWRTWKVDAQAGGRWTTEFAVPVDVGFVGLRGTPELERTIQRISIVPLAVVDAGRRPKMSAVVAASQFGSESLFYHDAYAFPEGAGFWIRGGRTTRVTIQRENPTRPLVLKIHSGLIPNRLHISMTGWTRTIALQRELPDHIEIPSGDRAVVILELSADDAFVPAEIVPSSRDTRPLGVWVEVVQP